MLGVYGSDLSISGLGVNLICVSVDLEGRDARGEGALVLAQLLVVARRRPHLLPRGWT